MTAETDKEFIEQAAARLEDLGETSELLLRNEGWDRLFALARRGGHLCDTARSLGWPDDDVEGAFEYVTRRTREVAMEDTRRGAEAAARIEQLEAALREIADCKTFTAREYMIGIARAALEEKA